MSRLQRILAIFARARSAGAGFAVRFKDLPIRQKLRIIFILTTVVALVLGGLSILAVDSVLFYRTLSRDMQTFVRIIGDNCIGALAFDDARAATETLASLRSRTDVQIACLYQSNGQLLAAWARPGYSGKCPKPEGEEVRLAHGDLLASHQIHLTDRPLGSLVLQYDLSEIAARIEIFGGTVMFVLLLSCLATVYWSSRLRALIAAPILELADTARSVSITRDYNIRAVKNSRDEIGELADALNQMMEGIQSRDDELRRALREQHDALELFQRSNADLARSNSDLERFAFVASHDLQEPLRMITAYTELLVDEYFRTLPASGSQRASENDGRASEFVKYIVGGTQRMRELLTDLLAYTEIAGNAAQPPEPVDLNEVLLRVRQTLGMAIKEAKAELVFDFLPVLNAHPGRMVSLFQNLISNAIKYRSSLPLQIRVSVEAGSDRILFSVADNGIGIEPEYQQRIFIAFQRLHGKEVPGTGIGLAICQRVVEHYGGRIWVDSEPGAGSTFRFTLPASMAVSAQAQSVEVSR
jgi:signal transduction histidine kinase